MADTKISALPASTTPLAGTEVLPIVQSGVTKQVSVANLTAGRPISATSVTASTGNFVVGTSGQGIDFSATPGTGTSELLADYEEGTWTPVISGDGTAGTYQLATAIGKYTKIGNLVTLSAAITLATPTGGGTGNLIITGNPFAKPASSPSYAGSVSGVMAVTIPMLVSFGTRGAASTLYAINTLGAFIQISEATAGRSLDFTIAFQV